ncbi:hypothetical protein TIFTF001_043032 [Ficus carica]|uniref:Uncharacterized protein n=1 Tax=Ficus carica TaxID=3494 RepID=A0AA87YW98_FICCA|nr:hypothetical protein TIFTF001_043032 [Ficus carica]
MSDVTDSENESLSGSVDVTGDSDTGASSSTSSSSLSSSTLVTPTSRRSEGAARLVEILQVGPGTRPDSRFIRELGGAAPEPPVQANSTGVASERSAGQASTSGREGTESSDSPDPAGEPLGDRDRPEGRAMRINNQRVYRRSDQEMVELAGGFPVYSVDFYTSTVTPGYLAALRRDFQIPAEVDLRVPGENNLPSRPPPGYIALSAEYFRAGLRLPLHPFLRRALTRLNVAPAQLNANAYRILVGCFILWAKNFAAELPGRAFQNLYQMKSASSSAGSYYFQGWLHGHLARNELPRSERVPVVFWNGYVWTRAPHIPETTRDMVAGLQNLADHERDQRTLLDQSCLSEHGWLGFASTSKMPSVRRPEPVTVARIPEPTVRYRSRSIAAPAEAASDQPETRGVASGVPVSQLPHGDTSPGSWGPRIADEDLDLVIRRLSPVHGQRLARGLQIKEPMADRRGTKRLTEEDRRERLAKMANVGKGKGKARTSAPPSQNVAPPATRGTPAPSAPATATAAIPTPAPQTSRPPGFSRDDRQPARPDIHSSRTREDRPVAQSLAPRSARGESRLDPAPLPLSQASSTYRALVTKFEERLSVEIVESSKHSDPIQAANDGVNKQIEALCIMLSGYAATKGFANQMADKRERYVRVALPAALEEARAQAVADFLGSEDFNERVAQMYREGMRDMKAGFTAANPSLVGVDWSFVPAESEETVAEEPPEEGEVTGTTRELGDVIILDDQVAEPEQPAPAESFQAAAIAEPEPDQSDTVVSTDQEQSEPPAT